MKDSVIIVSGGTDSITMLFEYKEDIALGISFDYGSNHNAREIPLAQMHCQHEICGEARARLYQGRQAV